MCGIVYAHDFEGKSVNNGVLNTFDKQRGRGTQGFGLFDGKFNNIVRSTTEDKILNWLCKYNSHLILFHHRLPTSTDNTKSTAHPFATKDHFGKTQYIMVHNGHISNSQELKTAHERLGITYHSTQPDGRFNDSEALLWDLALYLEGKQDDLKAEGAMAFICIKLIGPRLDKLYFGRNTNPLNMLKVKQGILLSSQGEGEPIDPHSLYCFNYKLKRLTSKVLSMPSYSYADRSYTHPKPYKYEEDEDDKLIEPDDDWETPEVEELVMQYLSANEGVFEIAYTELEYDYMAVADLVESKEDYQQMRKYERAIQYMLDDPEWLSEKSVSKAYLELKQRQLMLTEGV